MTKLFNYIFILNLIIFLSIKNIVAKENLVTDMSENSVEISSTFLGAKILLFGAYDGQKNDDIIVIVSGPKGKIKINKKVKKFGIWMTSENIIFSNVPNNQ